MGTTPGARRAGHVRTVLGDVTDVTGVVYAHEHLVIDSPLVAAAFPHIHLADVEAAVTEVATCVAAGVGLLVDTMPMSAGRDVVRLAEISRRTRADLVASTGLHHDRYYGPLHWTNRVDEDALVDLFVADLLEGVDTFDCTGPVVLRTEHRAGLVKVATSGPQPDARDRRNLRAVAAASIRTGAPVLTHCEGGVGGLAQVAALVDHGVPAGSILVSHVDKADDLGYLRELAASGARLELDQSLRQASGGSRSVTVRAVLDLVAAGFEDSVVLGTDGARRTLWRSLGGSPGLAWLAETLPGILAGEGLGDEVLRKILTANAVSALTWRDTARDDSRTTDDQGALS